MLIPNANCIHELKTTSHRICENYGKYNLFNKDYLRIGYYYNGTANANSTYDYYYKIPVFKGVTYACMPNSNASSYSLKGYVVVDEQENVLENKFTETKTMQPDHDGYAYVTIYHSDLSAA